MPFIKVHKDPGRITGCDIHEVPNETLVIKWASLNVDIAVLGCSVYLNGIEIADIDEMSPDEFIKSIDFTICNDDCVEFVLRPRGFDPISIAVASGIASAITTLLLPTPEIPNDAGRINSSPNNNLNAATNQSRPRLAIPDIAGQIVSFPDFIQPSYFEYVNNLRIVKEIFCIGVGRYQVDEVRTGETLINNLSGSSFIVHEPGSVPSELLNVRQTNEVDGFEILAENDPSIEANVSGGTVETGNLLRFNDNVAQNIGLLVNDTVTVDLSYQVSSAPQTLNGTFTVLAISDDSITLDTTIPAGDSGTLSGTIINDQANDDRFQWFTLSGNAIEEVWFQIQMPNGIRSADEAFTVNFDLQVESLDSSGTPTGSVTTVQVEIEGNTLDPQFRTFKITDSDGWTPARGRARAVRTNDTVDQSDHIDTTRLEDIQAVTSYSGANFGDVTLLEVNRRATIFATSVREDKINALVTRRLQLFRDGQVQNQYTATRSFADYAFYILHTLIGIPVSQIDTEGLFEISDGLSTPELGFFDFTFDDFNVGLRSRLETTCNAARVRYFNLPSPQWNFIREQEETVRSFMFNRRNIAPRSSRQVYKFQRTEDFDSVRVKYVDPDTNTEAVVERRFLDGSIVEGAGLRAADIDLAGCRNITQATNRAELEIRKIVYQRRQVSDVFLSDALFVGLGNRIQWADPNDEQIFSGEVLGFKGRYFDTSERVNLVTGETYFVNISTDDGSVSNTVQVTARSDTEFGFIAEGLVGAYLVSGDSQLNSRYFIYRDGEKTDLVVTATESPDERNNVRVTATEYTPEIFEQD